MLDAIQLHLAINHLPVVGTLIGLLVTLAGIGVRNVTVRRTGLAILVGTALLTIPAYLTGEPAEDALEKFGVSQSLVHDHEEAAEGAFVVILGMGALALASLSAPRLKKPELEVKATLATLAVAALAVVLIGRAAHLGGLIRHEELRPAGSAASHSEHDH